LNTRVGPSCPLRRSSLPSSRGRERFVLSFFFPPLDPYPIIWCWQSDYGTLRLSPVPTRLGPSIMPCRGPSFVSPALFFHFGTSGGAPLRLLFSHMGFPPPPFHQRPFRLRRPGASPKKLSLSLCCFFFFCWAWFFVKAVTPRRMSFTFPPIDLSSRCTFLNPPLLR